MNMKVRIYFNLHRKCLSVQHKTSKGWRVWKHVTSISLTNVTFKVSEAGRQRVLLEKKKNVHAFLEGTVSPYLLHLGDLITYNPYRFSTFVLKDKETPIRTADEVRVTGRIIKAINPKP